LEGRASDGDDLGLVRRLDRQDGVPRIDRADESCIVSNCL
jgi:hypothetical protein